MQISIADFAGVCISSVNRIQKRVSEAIARRADHHISMPRNEIEMREAAAGFFAIAKFPRTIGAIDCTHIKLQSPGGINAERYRNRKSWFSLNVQTVAASNLKIIDIVARWPGSTHDQTIFNSSSLKMRFESGEFGRYFIVGDSGYANSQFLPTPFLHLDGDPAKNLYNESQIRTRNVVERSYGVLKRRFPILATGLRVALDRVEAIIIACAVLHNICIDARDNLPPVEMEGFDEAMLRLHDVEQNFVETEDTQTARTGKPASARDLLVQRHFQHLLEQQQIQNLEQ